MSKIKDPLTIGRIWRNKLNNADYELEAYNKNTGMIQLSGPPVPPSNIEYTIITEQTLRKEFHLVG